MDINRFPGALEAARLQVVDYARATGKEYAIVLNRDGTRVAEKGGDENHVDLGMIPKGAWRGNWFIHSHPYATSLSPQDVNVGGSMELGAVEAVTPDGSIFTVTNIKATPENGYVVGLAAKQTRSLAHDLLYVGLEEDDIESIASHWFNRVLDAAGVLDYKFTLSNFYQAAWNKYVTISHEDDEVWAARRAKYGSR